MVDAGVQLATYYLESGNAAKAQPLLERALRYNNQNLVAHLNLGDVHRLMGRPADAKREFDWVLAKDSSLIQIHYNLGLLYLFSDSFPGKTPMQQVDAALASLEKYKELRGRSVDPRGGDVDQLIIRAKAKKAMVEAESKAPAPAAPAPATSAAPAGGG
jgi:tetratricopeptide (TPR) repeat protein